MSSSSSSFLSLSSLFLFLVLGLVSALPVLAQSSGSSSGGSSGAAMPAADAAGGDSQTKINWEWAHGALMSAAIGLFFPLGIAFARFCRSPQLSPAWLYAHQTFVTTGIVLLIAGFSIAVSKFDNDNYDKREGHYHRDAGFVVFSLFLFQFVLGFIRPHAPPIGSGEKLTAQRRAWNLVHHWNGRIAYVFGLAQIYTGIQILDGGNKTLWEILFSALWGSLFLILIFLQVAVCLKGSAFGDDGTATKVTVFGSTVDRQDGSGAATTSSAVRKGGDAPAPQARPAGAEMTQTSGTQPSEPSTMV